MGIRLKDLSKLGYRDNVARSLVVDIVGKYCKHDTKEQIAMTLSNILEHPESYKNNEIWSKLAERLSPTVLAKEFVAYDLREDPLMYKTYGGKFIETLAKQQMNLAMRLPVTVGGALMPDAHAGYGLPIGGVLATDNAVIPYAVGVDIGCRMSLTVFDAKADFLKRYSYQIKEALKDFTHFGIGVGLVVGCMVFLLVMLKGDMLAGFFTTDAAVIQKGYAYLKGFALETIVTAILFSMVGYFNGNNKTVWVMTQGLIQTLLVRLPFAYVMSIQPDASLTKIGLAAPVSTMVGIVLNVGFYIYLGKQEKKISKK